MPLDYSLWENDFLGDDGDGIDLGDDFLDEDKPTKTSGTADFYYGQRGVLGDMGSLLARGFASTLETLENAAEFFNANDSTIDTAAKLREFDLFKPDLDEYSNKGWLSDTFLGSIPSAVESMGPSLAAAGAGFAAGAALGGPAAPFTAPIGGFIGAALSSLGIMGTAEYQQTYETAIDQGLSEVDASALAWKTGAIEGLGESVGSLIGMGPLMKPFAKIAGQGLKTTLSGMTKMNVKAAAKEFFKVYAGEQITEVGQAVSQTKLMRDAGLTDVTDLEAAFKTVIPTLFMTGSFQLGTHSLKLSERAKLKKALAKESNPATRLLAAESLFQMIKLEDADIAEKFKAYAFEHINQGTDMAWDEDFAKFADQLQVAHTKPGEPFTDADIIAGTVTEEQLMAHFGNSRKSDIFTAFESSLLGLNKGEETLKILKPTTVQETAEQLAEPVKEPDTKDAKTVPLTPQEVEEAETLIASIEKVLENPEISHEIRVTLGQKAASLRESLLAPAEDKRQDPDARAKFQEEMEAIIEENNAVLASAKPKPGEEPVDPNDPNFNQMNAARWNIITRREFGKKGDDSYFQKVYYDFMEPEAAYNEVKAELTEETAEPKAASAEEAVIKSELQVQQEETVTQRKEEIIMIDEALEKGPSPEATTILTERKATAQAQIDQIENPPVTESLATTKEIALDIVEKLQQAQATMAAQGDETAALNIQIQIDKYLDLADTLPAEVTMLPEEVALARQEFEEVSGKPAEALAQELAVEDEADADTRAGIEEEEYASESDVYGQGVSVDPVSPDAIGTSEREVDLPSRIITWSQDLKATSGIRTSNIIIGRPRGINIEYWLLRDLEEKGGWILFKKEPGVPAVALHTFSTTKARIRGENARRSAAQYAEDHARGLGSTEWLPGKDTDGKNNFAIKVGDDHIVITEISKNNWEVEANGDLVQRDLEGGKIADTWASISIGNLKKEVEELFGFSTRDTAKELRTHSVMAEQKAPKPEGPKAPKRVPLAARDHYSIFPPVLDKASSDMLTRALVRPTFARKTLDHNYIGQVMTDDLRTEIETKIEELQEGIGEEQARAGFRVIGATGNALVASGEDNIISLSRLVLLKNGQKIRIQKGVNAKGKPLYFRPIKTKPRKEKAKGVKTIPKAKAEKATREVELGEQKSQAQIKRERAALEKAAEQYTQVPEETLEEKEQRLIKEQVNVTLREMGYPVITEIPSEIAPSPEGVGRPPQLTQQPQPTINEKGEIVFPETGSFERQTANTARQELINEAKDKYVQDRDVFADNMLKRIIRNYGGELLFANRTMIGLQGRVIPLETYYRAIFMDVFNKQNPFMPHLTLPETGQAPVAPPKGIVVASEPSAKVQKRKSQEKRRKILSKQRRRGGPAYLDPGGVPEWNNALEILEDNADTPLVKALLAISDRADLSNITVFYDPTKPKPYYQQNPDGTAHIVLNGDNSVLAVHEVVHGIIRERAVGGESIMEQLRVAAEELGILDHPSIQKALENTNEFASQAMSDPLVETLLQGIPTKQGGKLRTAWDNFVNWVRGMLKLPQIHNNALGEVLDILTKVTQEQADASLALRFGPAPATPEPLDIGAGAVAPLAKPAETEAQRRERVREVQREARKDVGATNWYNNLPQRMLKWSEQMFKFSKQFVQPVGDALYNIHPKLAALVRVREAQLSKRNKDQMVAMKPILQAIENFTEDEKIDFKSGWLNPDERHLLDNLIEAKGLQKEWKVFADIVKANEQSFLRLGVLTDKQIKEDYLPRVVNDPLGLINDLEDTPEGTAFAQQIRAERIRIERQGGVGAFDKAHEEEFIAKMLLNRRFNLIPKKGFQKERIIEHIPANLIQHYMDPGPTMIDYMHNANELIFQRELTGKSNRNKFLSQLASAVDQRDKLKSTKTPKYAKLTERIEKLANQIHDIDTDTRLAVDKLLMDKSLGLTDTQRKDAANLINSRLSQRGTRGAIRELKNVTLMMTIGNPLSAITQLGDQGFNLMDNGIGGLVGMSKAFHKEGRIVDNFDIENVLREFAKEGHTTQMLDWLLTKSGLKIMDTFGKESYMQGAMGRYGKMSFEEFENELGVYGEFLEGDQPAEIKLREAHESMVAKQPNENAMYVLFSELATRQPVSLSETSTKFLTAGQGRIFWVLKQFALKALSSAVQDIHEGINSGNPVKGILKAASLMVLLGMAGAGTDDLKDLLLGRESTETFPDKVIENMMDILFINRYTIERGMDMKKPFSSLLANNLMLPPARALDQLITDIVSTAQGDFSYSAMASLPMFGRIAFEYLPQGQEAQAKRMRRAVLELAEGGASMQRINELRIEFNKVATGEEGLEKITSETIRNARLR